MQETDNDVYFEYKFMYTPRKLSYKIQFAIFYERKKQLSFRKLEFYILFLALNEKYANLCQRPKVAAALKNK